MGRLIDADALYNAIKVQDIEFMQQADIMEILKSIIDEQPTAYDLEKVMEELERLEYFADKYNTSKQGIVNMAIEVVRKGGVE